jgi:hypothetical protein
MALVTLADAKRHLRITGDDENSDIDAKLEQANGIVLDYLKVRYTAIETIVAAAAGVITTSVPHSLTNGATALIAGTTTTPTVNGLQVVTVTSPTTFTVPVTVTAGQSAAAGTVATPTWTGTTVPKPIEFGILSVLEDLHEHRPIDWVALGAIVMRFRDPALA